MPLGGVYGKYDQGAVMLEPSGRQVWLGSLEGTFDLGFASLTSDTSYTDHHGTSVNDNSGLYAKAFPFLYNFYPRLMAQKYRNYSDETFAQEFRLVSNTKGPFDYIAGLFFEDERMSSGETDWVRGYSQWYAAQNAVTPGFSYYDPVAPTSDRDYLYNRNEQYKEVALFGELTYHLTEKAQITGGARVFRYTDANQLSVMPDLPTRQPLVSPVTPDVSTTKSIFKVNGLYRLTEQDNLYATFSQGYRRGGVNDIPIKPPSNVGENAGWMNFGPDTLDNYELGVKGAHGNISYNVSVFDIEWKDIQLNTATPVWGYYVTVNAGQARSTGFELELHGKVGPALTYGLGYTYADARLTSDATQPFAVPPAPPVVIAPSGTQLPAAPEKRAQRLVGLHDTARFRPDPGAARGCLLPKRHHEPSRRERGGLRSTVGLQHLECPARTELQELDRGADGAQPDQCVCRFGDLPGKPVWQRAAVPELLR